MRRSRRMKGRPSPLPLEEGDNWWKAAADLLQPTTNAVTGAAFAACATAAIVGVALVKRNSRISGDAVYSESTSVTSAPRDVTREARLLSVVMATVVASLLALLGQVLMKEVYELIVGVVPLVGALLPIILPSALLLGGGASLRFLVSYWRGHVVARSSSDWRRIIEDASLADRRLMRVVGGTIFFTFGAFVADLIGIGLPDVVCVLVAVGGAVGGRFLLLRFTSDEDEKELRLKSVVAMTIGCLVALSLSQGLGVLEIGGGGGEPGWSSRSAWQENLSAAQIIDELEKENQALESELARLHELHETIGAPQIPPGKEGRSVRDAHRRLSATLAENEDLRVTLSWLQYIGTSANADDRKVFNAQLTANHNLRLAIGKIRHLSSVDSTGLGESTKLLNEYHDQLLVLVGKLRYQQQPIPRELSTLTKELEALNKQLSNQPDGKRTAPAIANAKTYVRFMSQVIVSLATLGGRLSDASGAGPAEKLDLGTDIFLELAGPGGSSRLPAPIKEKLVSARNCFKRLRSSLGAKWREVKTLSDPSRVALAGRETLTKMNRVIVNSVNKLREIGQDSILRRGRTPAEKTVTLLSDRFAALLTQLDKTWKDLQGEVPKKTTVEPPTEDDEGTEGEEISHDIGSESENDIDGEEEEVVVVQEEKKMMTKPAEEEKSSKTPRRPFSQDENKKSKSAQEHGHISEPSSPTVVEANKTTISPNDDVDDDDDDEATVESVDDEAKFLDGAPTVRSGKRTKHHVTVSSSSPTVQKDRQRIVKPRHEKKAFKEQEWREKVRERERKKEEERNKEKLLRKTQKEEAKRLKKLEKEKAKKAKAEAIEEEKRKKFQEKIRKQKAEKILKEVDKSKYYKGQYNKEHNRDNKQKESNEDHHRRRRHEAIGEEEEEEKETMKSLKRHWQIPLPEMKRGEPIVKKAFIRRAG